MQLTKTKATAGAAVISLGIMSTADAALLTRLGGQAVYDTDLNITWIADANLALSNQFGLTLSGNVSDDTTNTVGSTGAMTWDNANAWIAGMNADGGTGYLGFDDWRLPITPQPDASCEDQSASVPSLGSGTGCEGSEMGHLFYEELIRSSAPGLFTNVQPDYYWSGSQLTPNVAWFFNFNDGDQTNDGTDHNFFAWAVRSGDVSTVPVPAAVWLFGSGLLGLIGVQDASELTLDSFFS